jgi:hypothetical protein
MRNIQTRRRRIVLLAAVAILLLLSTAASARPGGDHAVEEGTLSGGGYRLTSVSLPAGSTMSGGGYQLLSLARSMASGSGCCCTYLPCIVRNP